MKYVWKFQKLAFRILIARSRQRFALSVTTSVFVTASAWTDRTAAISISSRVSLDMNALFATSVFIEAKATNIIVLSKVSRTYRGISCSPSPVLRNQPTSVAGYFLVSGLSSSRKGVACKLNPCAHLGRQNILQQHVCPAYFAFYSKKLLSGSPK